MNSTQTAFWQPMKTIISNVSWLTLQDLSFHVLGMVFFVVLARQLGEVGLGTYSYLFAVVGFASYFIDFGITTSYWRKWTTDQENFQEEVKDIIGTKLVLAGLTGVGLFAYVWMSDRSLLLLFSLVFGYHVIEIVRTIPIFFLQANNKFKDVFAINAIDRYLSLGIGAILLWFSASLEAVLWVFILARFLSVGWGLYCVRLPWQLQVKRSKLIATVRAGALLFFIQILTVLYFRIDTLMIRQMVSLEAVGVYNAAYRILESLLVVPTILLYALFAPLNTLLQEKKFSIINSILNTSFKYLTIVSLFLAIFFQLCADQVLLFLYGSQFDTSANVLRFLGWTLLLVFINAPLQSYLLAQKKDLILLGRALALTIINVGLNLWLIPHWGVLGAGVSTLVTESINFVLLMHLTRPQIKFGWVIMLLGVGSMLMILGWWWQPIFWVAIPTFGLVYLGALMGLKVITWQEIQQALSKG